MYRYRTSCFKYTSHDWCSNYKIEADARHRDKGYVQVSYSENFTPEGGLHRVAVWGNDDFGMNVDFTDHMHARETYWAVTFLSDVTPNGLELLGFEWF